MAFKKYLKYAKGVARRVARKGIAVAKKRYTVKGQPNVKNIAKDVAMLKSLVNVEKKRSDVTITTAAAVAQFAAGGTSGQYSANLTPVIAEGAQGNQRNGNSVKLVSGCLDIQFKQAASQVNLLKLRYFIVCRPDNAADNSAPSSIAQFLEPNPFSTVNDYYSARDAEYFTALKVIKTGTVTLGQDQITSGSSIKQLRIPLRFNHHLKFATDAATITTKNKFMLFILASDGNTTTSTGAEVLWNMRWYYTDN